LSLLSPLEDLLFSVLVSLEFLLSLLVSIEFLFSLFSSLEFLHSLVSSFELRHSLSSFPEFLLVSCFSSFELRLTSSFELLLFGFFPPEALFSLPSLGEVESLESSLSVEAVWVSKTFALSFSLLFF